MRLLKVATLMAAAVVALGVTAAPARATILNPSTTIGAPATTTFFGGTILAYNSGPVSCPGCTFSGLLQTVVVRNGSGTLDFYYQFKQTSSGPDANSFAMSNFNGFTTDVYNISNGSAITCLGCSFSDATIGATSALRNAGATLDFYFSPGFGLNDVAMIAIRTNATHYGVGNFSVQDGGSTAIAGFAPVTVPEPSSMLLLATGLASLAGFRRRKT